MRAAGFAVPGFVDLQVNGFGGVDFLDASSADYRVAGDALLETGVTAFLPTLITSPEEELLAALREVPRGEAPAADPRRAISKARSSPRPPRRARRIVAPRPGPRRCSTGSSMPATSG